MQTTENGNKYTVSKHAMQRYAERIMEKDNAGDVTRFILGNEVKIESDINKLIAYGDMIFSGQQRRKDGKGAFVDVYVRDCWVVIADTKSLNVITIYKIDLDLGDDFNRMYIERMIDKFNERKENLASIQQQVQEESGNYRAMITDAEAQIKEYRGMIKNLEELCEAYKTVIDNNCVRVSQANREVLETLNSLIGWKEF